MTYDEIIEKWGDTILWFSSYYKYNFTFVGDGENGERIVADIGGTADDIYKEEISANESRMLGSGEWESIWVRDRYGNTIAEWSR